MKIQSSLSILNNKALNFDVGTITAFRPEFDYDSNCQRNHQMLAYLLDKKYSVTSVKGSYIKYLEGSNPLEIKINYFFVADHKSVGNLISDLQKLGQHFDQGSIFFRHSAGATKRYETIGREFINPVSNRLVNLDSKQFCEFGENFFGEDSDGQFFVENVLVVDYPGTINGIRGMKMAIPKFSDGN